MSKKKQYKYSVGDIVVFKHIVGYWGSGKGVSRDQTFPFFEGEMGEIKSIYPGKYPYFVEFSHKNKLGKPLRGVFSMLEDELEPVFTV